MPEPSFYMCVALKLKQSYFRNRENRTRVGNSTSIWGPMKRSCPQGSSLGPLLWNIYQNDRFYAGVKSQLSAYADDHQQYSSNKELRTAIDEVEKDGVSWYKSNFLEGNYSKYQTMIIARETQRTELVINNSKIDITDAFKLLGVIIDKDLNFTEHISQVCLKTNKMIVVLRRLKNLIPIHAKLRIDKTAILPRLTYCSLVWHFCCASDTRKLEGINERRLRTVFCDRVSS